MTKKQLREEGVQMVRALLQRDPVAVEDAVLTIYERQTSREQSTQATLEDNGVGFNATDAELLSSFAEQIKKNRAEGTPPGRCLSVPRGGKEGQIGWARRKMWKYAGQLLDAGWLTEERKASIRLSDERSSPNPGRTSGKTFRSRTEALADALDRIERGKAFIYANEQAGANDDVLTRARARLERLKLYAQQLVTDATSKDLRDEDFRTMARQAKVCSNCGGKGNVPRGKGTRYCYRCGGKGFQTAADEQRNDQYDRRGAGHAITYDGRGNVLYHRP